ncbi:MAG: sensor domain-containing diguanylate cyclase [Candidatus Pelagadaptatus aseana]|uniref:sensor domain-containing diguanylate cyclase n=1 Tax=Candidatus Pelagadaptatus aseana TaxID=3120508 RepID=UPI0039B323F9
MSNKKQVFEDVHWLMDALQGIDVGLVVMDQNFNIQVWNRFMQNHSAKTPSEVMGQNIFELFPELPESWFKRKVQSVFVLRNTAFTTWEQRPYLFRFKHYRPITGTSEHMYQNSTIMPLMNSHGEVEQICLVIYDVTDTAVSKLALQDANQALERLSQTDALTGLYNRGHWEKNLQQEFNRFTRYKNATSLIMFDIDHFKRVNDEYGHPTGDAVIRETAEEVLRQVRDLDIAGRYGGEEFGIILTETDADGAVKLAERLRASIEQLVVEHEDYRVRFTISLGVVELNESYGNYKAWLEKTDQALYESKKQGRNTVTLL